MEFNLTPKQALAYLKLIDNTTKEIGYGGGAGGGKSILGCGWILTQAQKYPGTAWLIGRKELTNLKKTTLLSFFEIVKILGLKNEELFTLNSQTNIITFHNGSLIFLMDTAFKPSDPLNTRFGSLNLTGAFLDESNENDSSVIEIIKTRLGRCKNEEYGLIPKLLETFNPDKGHVYRKYYKPWRDKELPKHVTFIPALVTDNPYLKDTAYVEQLKNADKITKERLLYGNFEYDDDPAKLFEYEKILDIFTNAYVLPSKHQNYITGDIARKGKDKSVIIAWKGWYVDKIYINPVIREGQFMRARDNITLGDELQAAILHIAIIHKVPRSNIILDEDGLGGHAVDNLKGVKGFINNSSPIETKFSKKIHNYANLKAQCYFLLANIVNYGKIGCYDVPEEIKNLIIADLEQVSQKDIDKDGKIQLVGKEEIKEKLGHSPDCGDALMMRAWFDLKTSYKPHIA